MSNKILLVDDDENILAAYKRQLHGKYDLSVALGAEEGLECILFRGPYAVVVTDYHMPGTDGLQFIAKIKEENPETVCLLITGHADLNVAIEALNTGNIFRFITKPCDSELFVRHIAAGLRQYDLIQAAKELSQLKGFLAMCCSCKKMRDGKGNWQSIEEYIETHSTASVSHSYCPDCLKELHLDINMEMNDDDNGDGN